MADGTPMCGVLEQDPYPMADGRIVGACHFQPGLHVCPVYTDDPTGHGGWHRTNFHDEDRGPHARERPVRRRQRKGEIKPIQN